MGTPLSSTVLAADPPLTLRWFSYDVPIMHGQHSSLSLLFLCPILENVVPPLWIITNLLASPLLLCVAAHFHGVLVYAYVQVYDAIQKAFGEGENRFLLIPFGRKPTDLNGIHWSAFTLLVSRQDTIDNVRVWQRGLFSCKIINGLGTSFNLKKSMSMTIRCFL